MNRPVAETHVRVAGRVEESIVDGPGLRYVLFTQGCPHACPGCHNPETHDFAGGTAVSVPEILRDIRKNPLVRGVTLSGGEPFCQSDSLVQLAVELRRLQYHIMGYTGYLWEELHGNPLLRHLDLLVDGPFIQEERSLELTFRGSRNQRIIDVQASLRQGKPVFPLQFDVRIQTP